MPPGGWPPTAGVGGDSAQLRFECADDGGMALVEDRARFAAGLAEHLVEALDGPAACQGMPERVSRHFTYAADEERLFILAGPQEATRPATLDLALAYGLSYAWDRDLTVVLPMGGAEASVRRAAWLDLPIRVVEYDPNDPAPEPRPRVIPARAVVLEELRARPLVLPPGGPEQTDVAWVSVLAAWAEDHLQLRPAHRNGRWAWHCQGRSVLRISRGAGELVIQAGVDTAGGGGRFAPPVELRVTGELTADQLAQVCLVVEAAIEQRQAGADRQPSEHWLQAVLRDCPELLGLQDGPVLRELPAFRPEAGMAMRCGFVDLVGVTQDGRIGVVETKLGSDPMLVLQGLDYWTWVTAHGKELANELGADPDRGVELIFAVDAKDGTPRVSPHMAAQARTLAGEIRWRIVGLEDWFLGAPRPAPLRARTPPPGHPTPRFAERLEAQQTRVAPGPLRQRVFLADPTDGVLPRAVQTRQAVAKRGLLHPMDAHLRSSQRFAINLFAPLPSAAVAQLLGGLFGNLPVEVDPVKFEFADQLDRLRERRPASPHQTQVDVLLRGTAHDGRRLAALVEVKLSERDFGHCSGYESRRNPTRDACLEHGPFGGQPARCFQLHSDERTGPRTYDRYLDPVGPLPGHAGCLFRLGLNQPMRNLALARVLLAEGEVDQAVYVLCAHDHNGPIWRRWAEATGTFSNNPTVNLAGLAASQVVGLHQPDDAAWLRRHYALP